MGSFTEAELACLQPQPLMRLALASPKGRPDVVTVVIDDLASVDPRAPRGINEVTEGISIIARRKVNEEQGG